MSLKVKVTYDIFWKCTIPRRKHTNRRFAVEHHLPLSFCIFLAAKLLS